MCNVCSINIPAKQDDIICWHRDSGNLVSIITETKLRSDSRLWINDKFDGVRVFSSGLDKGFLDAGVAIIMDSSLAHHVSKISEVPGQLLLVKLLFKNKLSVSILGLYAGASLAVCFFQAFDINSMIAKAINESSFVVLGSDFNKNGFRKCASFKKCLDLGLVNSLSGSFYVKESTWANFQSVAKTINFLFISSNLVNAVVDCEVSDVAVFMSVDLGRLLDKWLNSLHKHANKDQWKFNFKNAGVDKWNNFKDVIMANKKWFKNNDHIFTKGSSRFHRLELLVSKIVRAFRGGVVGSFVSLVKCWCFLDRAKALIVQDLVDFGASFDCICSALSGARKSYHALKLTESLRAKKGDIKSAINKRMESFEIDKGHTIKSVLEHPFRKVVLNHLVVDNELVLEPSLVKSKIDSIMGISDVSDDWCWQYWLLEYIFDGAFSGVMCSIDFDEFFEVVSNLLDGKAAGLSGISNKLWKHCDKSILDMLLVLLNCVLTNTCPIALIKTACKILSKIFSDRIFSTCSTFDVLYGDNFSVLKGTMTQSVIFAIGLVIKDALEKNRELWLVLQNMWKAYDSVGWDHLKKSLVMTDFGLTDGYHVHDGLDQGEVFSPLLWYVFYNPLLCKVKCQKSVCGYRINSHFISKSGRTESRTGFSSFFAAGAFIDDTIWVGSSWNATQHIFDVASDFFQINDISINNKKTVAIPINSRISNPFFFISGSLITIAKKEESHQYLGIFLLTESFSKPSLAKVHSDVRFFTNLVLRKVVLDKQFLYLMSVVFYSIVSYKMQFSFVPDALICKGLKLKSGLPLDFSSDTIHHPSFYDLRSFLQIQSKSKIASLVDFINSDEILGCFLVLTPCLSVGLFCSYLFSAFNNFLTGIIHILLDCNLSLSGPLVSFFWFHDGMPMSTVLNHHGVVFDWYTFKQWKRLDPHGPVPDWFRLSTAFLNSISVSPICSMALCGTGLLNILEFSDCVSICNYLSQVNANVLSVYTDGSLKNFGTANYSAGVAAFFEDIGLGLGVGVMSLMSSILVESQAIVLALECVLLSSSVHLFLDSQSALDAYKSELGLVAPDFCNHKNLKISWHKVKGHSGVLENKCADMIVGTASLSGWCHPPHMDEHFIVADDNIVSGNSRHFEIGSGCKFLETCLLSEVDWIRFSLVWHLDLHMDTGFTSRLSSYAHTYFIKALHYHLPVVVRKRLYNRLYPSVLCLYCSEVEVSDHAFFCKADESACHQLLDFHVNSWRILSGSDHASLCVLQLLSSCTFNSSVYIALFKSFVFDGWFRKTISIFHYSKLAGLEIVKFVYSLSLAFRNNIWLVRAKHHAYIEKHGLIPLDGSAITSVSSLPSGFPAGVVKLLGMADAFGICFGSHKSCSFFSGLSSLVSVYIAA
ncbi:hypothetical protein G9A89_021620 [Geosiphon pyriformis]|nr:hypothetical protein G9A89_021620 [Geosiphon pyriformis]